MLRGCPPDVVKVALDLVQLHVKESADIHPISGGHPVDRVAENRRAYDRERQRIKRERDKERSLSSFPSSSDSTLEKEEEVVVARESKPRARRGLRLPDDWKPNVGHYAAGKQLGYADDAAVDDQAKDMRIWADANSHRAIARKSDWDSTFLGWLRRSKPKCAIINGYSGFAPRPGSREDRAERSHDAYRKLSEYVESNSDVPTGGSGPSEETAPGLHLIGGS
jgi:hypothetical protein